MTLLAFLVGVVVGVILERALQWRRDEREREEWGE